MATGTRYSYTDTGNTKRGIADVINMIDWTEAPLLRILGFDSGNVGKFNIVNWPSTKVELLEDTMSGYAGTLDEADDGSEVALDVQSGEGALFRAGDLIQIGSEQMLVASVSGDTITVHARGYNASGSGTAHDDDTVVQIVGRALPEAQDYTTGHTTTTTQPYNYSQIISEAAKVSKTDAAISKYGITDQMAYNVTKLLADGNSAGKLAQLLQKSFYYGTRLARSNTTTAPGTMGGFSTFVTTNVTNLSSATWQRDHIHTKLRTIRDAGGRANKLITGSWGIEKITQMYEGNRYTTTDSTRGGSEITMIKTPHGELEVVYDWMCPAGFAYYVNSDKVGWLPLRPFATTEIKEQGDYFVRDVVGEYTFLVCNEESHGIDYGFSTTS